jgi:hypothetical protein
MCLPGGKASSDLTVSQAQNLLHFQHQSSVIVVILHIHLQKHHPYTLIAAAYIAMIYSRMVDMYLDDPEVYVRNLGIKRNGNPDGQKTDEQCLDDAHTRTFIDSTPAVLAETDCD